MGVHGLWKLLEPAGKPVPIETLENKVLAVDVSIWLHQATRGFQDARGQALPNAHLLGLFHRLCKLLYWRIRPVFVFDGGAPLLKQQTVAARRRRRAEAEDRAERSRRRLLQLRVKELALRAVLGKGPPAPPAPRPPAAPAPAPDDDDDLFRLPAPPPRKRTRRSAAAGEGVEDAEEEEDDGASTASAATGASAAARSLASARRAAGRVRTRGGAEFDLHAVDVASADFKALPVDVRLELLAELKETRKQSSWGSLHRMPRAGGEFSGYQMQRLLQRRSVQAAAEAAEREAGGAGGRTASLAQLRELMAEVAAGALPQEELWALGTRVASDPLKRCLYLTAPDPHPDDEDDDIADLDAIKDDLAEDDIKYEEDLKKKSECLSDNEGNTSLSELIPTEPLNVIHKYFEEYSDDEDNKCFPEFDYVHDSNGDPDDLVTKQLKAAQDFIFDNSGLTQEQILALIKENYSPAKPRTFDQPSTSKEICIQSSYSSNLKSEVSSEIEAVKPDPRLLTDKLSSSEVTTCKQTEVLSNTNIGNENSSKSLVKTLSVIPKEENIKQESICTIDHELNGNLKKENEKPQTQNNPISKFPILVSSNKLPEPKSSFSNDNATFSKSDSKENIKQEVAHSIENTMEKKTDLPTIKGASEQAEKHGEEKESSSDEDLIEVIESEKDTKITDTMQSRFVKAPLEVVIQTKVENLEEDIFADVFETNDKDTNVFKTEIVKPFKKEAIEQREIKPEESQISVKKPVNLEEPAQDVTGIKSVQDITDIKINESVDIENETFSNSDVDEVMIMSDTGSELEENTVEVNKSVSRKEPAQITTAQLEEMQSSLNEEGNRLQKEHAKEERLAATITEQMVQEAQDLLQMFGVPYVVAPMEAEAQCAFLDRSCLTDGTITDDSDIWLFGGQKVYKNFFDQKKHVLQFRDLDILHYFKLSRSQLILLALLVGSDYTTGVPGVGPVTALEILAAFPNKIKQGHAEELVEGLKRFREWFASGSAGSVIKAKLRKKLRDVELSGEFPSVPVVEAYMAPKVDESMEKFSWGTPDVDSIKEFARLKFGWPTSKTHEILQPIVKKLNIKISQLSIDSYFQVKPKLPPPSNTLSKRLHDAIETIGAYEDNSSEDEITVKKTKRTIKRNKEGTKVKAIAAGDSTSSHVSGCQSRRGRGRGRGSSPNELGPKMRAVGKTDSNTSKPSTSGSNMEIGRGAVSSLMRSKGEEFILQREKDKINMLKNKLKAIEVFRKSARGLDKTKRDKKKRRTILSDANLSESSDDE